MTAMTARDAIRQSLETADFVANAYLNDLSDADLLVRALPGMNPIAWQLGHLISSEREMMAGIGAAMPELPAGFTTTHAHEAAGAEDVSRFSSKAAYLDLQRRVRAATLAALDRCTPEQLAAPAPEAMRSYAPTVLAVFTLIPGHTLMHAGQWVAVRRKLGKPIAM